MIKHSANRQYVLTSLGKVVYNTFQLIDKATELQWALNALDAIHLTNTETDATDKVVQVLIPDEKIRNMVMDMK